MDEEISARKFSSARKFLMSEEIVADDDRTNLINTTIRGISSFTRGNYTDHLDREWMNALRAELEGLYGHAYEAGHTDGYEEGEQSYSYW